MSEHNDDRTRTFGARAPSVTPTAVHVTEIREWRQRQEENYNKLVIFVRELSQAKAIHPSHWVIDASWKSDAIKLLSTIEN